LTDSQQDPNVPPIDNMIPITSQLVNTSTDVQKVFNQLINLSENVLHEPTCIICSSPYRNEIEQIWSNDKDEDNSASNIADVKAFIKQKLNITVSKDIIINHMMYHFNSGVREIQKMEYADRLHRQLSTAKLTSLDRIEICFAALNERLMGINSIIPSKRYSPADIEKIKSSEVNKLMTSYNTLLKSYMVLTGEMQKSGEFIMIPQRAFIEFITESLAEAKDDNEKQIINKLLDKMKSLAKSA